MNLRKENWNVSDYQEYIKYLKSIKEESYACFHKKLTPTKYEILGIRVPIQRKIAKEILKGNVDSFLSCCGMTYYEEVNIEGFVISSLKEEEKFDFYFHRFLPKIDNWAICDGFCSHMNIILKKKPKYFSEIKQLLKSKNDFTVRVGIVLLLHYYVDKEYIDQIFSLVSEIKNQNYYVKMAIAWLVAECYIKFPLITYDYLKENHLDVFTHNKTISKVCDSYRVTKEQKDLLRSLHRS